MEAQPSTARLPNQHGPGHAATDDQAVIAAVAAALAAVGGDRFLTPPAGADAVSLRIAAEGRCFDGAAARMVDGPPSRCHDTVEVLVAADSTLEHFFGWALSDDGMWRVHSWAVAADGVALEATPVRRQQYFGVALTDGEAEDMWGEPALWADRASARTLDAVLEATEGPKLGDQVKVHITFGDGQPVAGESLWATRVEGGFRIDSVPFFASGLTFHSVVSAEPVAGYLEVSAVLSHEFAATCDIAFTEAAAEADVAAAVEALRVLGCVLEGADGTLFVAAVPESAIDAVAAVLDPTASTWDLVRLDPV